MRRFGPPIVLQREILRGIYFCLAAVSLCLGVIGVFLPLMPTTVFVLMAAWCFSKSSPRVEAWLIERSPFRHIIHDWRAYRIIPLSAKVLAGLSLVVCLCVSYFLFHGNVLTCLLVGLSLIGLYAYMLSFPHKPPQASEQGLRPVAYGNLPHG